MKIKKIHNFQIACCYDGIPENLLQWKDVDVEKYELLDDGYIIEAKDIAEESETYCFRLLCEIENKPKCKELICSDISGRIDFNRNFTT